MDSVATKAESLADDLVRRFEARIEEGAMEPGARFPTEKVIAETFGVSRTVVREAYSRLAERGLLESRRGSGAFVPADARYRAFQIGAAELDDLDDVIHLLELRMGFETEMAALAAARRTDADLARIRAALDAMTIAAEIDASVEADAAFHSAIAAATSNAHFLRFTRFLGVRMVPSRRLFLEEDDVAGHRRYAWVIDREHRAIFRAIEARDAVAARRAARGHIAKSIIRHRARADAARSPDPLRKAGT